MADEQSTLFKNSTIEMPITDTRTLADGLVLVDSDATIKNALAPNGKPVDMNDHIVLIFKQSGKDWKLLAARPYAFMHSGPPPAK